MHEAMHPIKIGVMEKNHEHDAQAPIAPSIGSYFIIDQIELMQAALNAAKNRVVLKWPRSADPMPEIMPPSHQILGKSTRYDVFMKP